MSLRAACIMAALGTGTLVIFACGSSSDSGGGGGADAGTDAPPTFTRDGGGADSFAPGGDRGEVACGSARCPVPAEHCCIGVNERAPPTYLFACANGTGCPKNEAGADSVALG